jgi:DNA-binding MarR family transcriptional regulator
VCAGGRAALQGNRVAKLRLDSRQALALWHAVVLGGMARGQPDLTTRQMAVLLQVYLQAPPHTVRGLAAALGVSKPAVTRAVDRLESLNFVRRRKDETDKRSVLVQRTVAGSVFLRDFADLASRKAEEL